MPTYKMRLHCGYSEVTYFLRVAALSSLITFASFSRSGNDPATFWNTSQPLSDRTSFPGVVDAGRSWSLHRNWVARTWRKARSARVVTWELSSDRNKLVRPEAGASYACMTRYEIAPTEFVNYCHACLPPAPASLE